MYCRWNYPTRAYDSHVEKMPWEVLNFNNLGEVPSNAKDTTYKQGLNWIKKTSRSLLRSLKLWSWFKAALAMPGVDV